MRFPRVDDLISWYKKKKGAVPLLSHEEDRKLLQRVHGRGLPGLQQIRHIGRLLSPTERQWLRVSAAIFLVGVMWFGFQVVGKYRTEAPARGGIYTEAVVGSPQLINPIFASVNDVDVDIVHLLYSGLLRYDEAQRLVPDLAAHYEVSDDKKVYTFTLRKDVVWHDGEPFSARDVAFTIEAIQNPAIGSPLFVSFQGVTVSVLDDYTIAFTLKEPFAPFLSALRVGILPEHAWADVQSERLRLAQLNLQPIGTGPFRFKKLVKDDSGNMRRYELQRFDTYSNTPALLDEFAFQFYANYDGQNGAIAALRQQEVDGLNFVPYDVRDKIQRKHIDLHTLQLPQHTALFFNADGQKAVKYLDVRSALSLALDKDRIVRESINKDGQVIESPILPGFPGYSPELGKTPYAPDQANKLLDKAWPRVSAGDYRNLRKTELLKLWNDTHQTASSSSDTAADATTTLEQLRNAAVENQLDQELHTAQTFYRKDKDGNVIVLSLVTADTPEYRQVAQLVAGFWQDVGMKTNITLVPVKDFSHDVLRTRQYDALLYGVIIGSDPDQYPFWHSSQIDFPGLNLSRYVNRTVDTILEQARATSNPDTLDSLYQKFQESVLKDRPAIFLYTPTYTYATSDKIHGIIVTRIFHPSDRFANVTRWYMKTRGEWKLRN